MARASDAIKELFIVGSEGRRFFEVVRQAKSWVDIEVGASKYNFELHPAVDDIIAVGRESRQSLLLSDSGHFFYFIVERLGHPPGHLMPRNYFSAASGCRVKTQVH